jgi:hypothetical protein
MVLNELAHAHLIGRDAFAAISRRSFLLSARSWKPKIILLSFDDAALRYNARNSTHLARTGAIWPIVIWVRKVSAKVLVGSGTGFRVKTLRYEICALDFVLLPELEVDPCDCGLFCQSRQTALGMKARRIRRRSEQSENCVMAFTARCQLSNRTVQNQIQPDDLAQANSCQSDEDE